MKPRLVSFPSSVKNSGPVVGHSRRCHLDARGPLQVGEAAKPTLMFHRCEPHVWFKPVHSGDSGCKYRES